MRIAFILFLLSFTSSLFSQNNFAKELKEIIKDSANHFQKFKGTAMEMSDTESSYYNSTILLEGTRRNWVIIHRSVCSYDADIADSVTKNRGKKILDAWKIKLASILGEGYKIEKSKLIFDNLFSDGWNFKRDNFSLSIMLSQHFYNKSLYVVRLSIGHEHPTPKSL
jgi:hypothetical protein